jgi:alpha-galactosidase
MSRNLLNSTLVGLFALASGSYALKDGLALTPPMGWNTWNTFFGGTSEALVLQAANAMVKSGMKDAGYQYIVQDDGWIGGRAAGTNKPLADASKFPHGMKWLTDSIHALGLKAGIYTAVGSTTCLGLDGSLDYEAIDAQQYADWGFDFLKNDWCKNIPSTWTNNPMGLYSRMKNGIKATKRPIVLSICEKGQSGVKTPWTWSDSVGHMWRTTNDINSSFSTVIGRNVNGNADFAQYQHPGGYNDPDMLEVGNTSSDMNQTEFQSHFSLWCVMGSPLMAGNDIRSMTAAVTGVLCNKDAIAVDQDSLGLQGRRTVNSSSGEMVFVKRLKNSATRAVLLFNYGSAAMTASIKWTDDSIGWMSTDKVTVYDLWSKAKMTGVTSGYTSTGIPKDGCTFLLLTNESMATTGLTDKGLDERSVSIRQTPGELQIVLPGFVDGRSMVVTDLFGKRLAANQVQPGVFSIGKRDFAPGVLFATLEDNGAPVHTWRIVNVN